MRFIAKTKEEYSQMALLQKYMTQVFKTEKGSGSKLEEATKNFINSPIEKEYEVMSDVVKNADITNFETDNPLMYKAYITKAAMDKKKLAIEYKDSKGNVSTRIIEAMNWKNDQLVAFCHGRQSFRQFKLDNIIRLAITDNDIERHEDVLI